MLRHARRRVKLVMSTGRGSFLERSGDVELDRGSRDIGDVQTLGLCASQSVVADVVRRLRVVHVCARQSLVERRSRT